MGEEVYYEISETAFDELLAMIQYIQSLGDYVVGILIFFVVVALFYFAYKFLRIFF